MIKKELIQIVGFDLDGTLYETTPEMDKCVRTQIAIKLMQKYPSLKNIEAALKYFEKRYVELKSGTMVLAEAGYANASQVMDECNARADVAGLIRYDIKLASIMQKLCKQIPLYLLTSSPEECSREKLTAIGINYSVFWKSFYHDTPNVGSKSNGSAFQYAIMKTGIPAPNHVYVGNRANSDITPAKKLGIQTIAVWTVIPEADISIPNIHKLEEILLN